MKSQTKSILAAVSIALFTLSANAQQSKTPKQVKVYIKTNDNGKTEVFEASELTPEVEKRLKEAGINISDLRNGAKVTINKTTNTKTESSGQKSDSKSSSISISTSSESEGDNAEVKLININGGNVITKSDVYTYSTSDDDVKVIVNGEEVVSERGSGKGTKVIFISTNLLNTTAEERQKAGITDTKEHLEIKEMVCMPNPTNGKFKISFETDNKTEAALDVRDINGKIVLSEKLSHSGNGFSKEIDLGEQAKGVYFVTISQSGKTNTKKLILH